MRCDGALLSAGEGNLRDDRDIFIKWVIGFLAVTLEYRFVGGNHRVNWDVHKGV